MNQNRAEFERIMLQLIKRKAKTGIIQTSLVRCMQYMEKIPMFVPGLKEKIIIGNNFYGHYHQKGR